MLIGNTSKIGETGSAVSGGGSAAARRDAALRVSPVEFFSDAVLRRIAESGEDDVSYCRRPDRSPNAVNAVKAAGWRSAQSNEEALRLQHLDQSVREAAAILYAVIILGAVATGLLAALLLWRR